MSRPAPRPAGPGRGRASLARPLGVALAVGALSIAGAAAVAQAPPAPFDLIVRGGSVLDGTGRPAQYADVGVVAGRIARVGDLSRDRAALVIDAAGLVVAPGFINIHSHPTSLPAATNMLKQGVTTEIINADGGGPLDIAHQLAAIEGAAPAVNIGAYAPFNAAWERVVGTLDRRPPPAEIAQVTALLERGLEAGAWGISAGLEYKPAYFATTDEVVAALAPLRGWRTNFPNHDRLTPEAGWSSIAAMRETIEIAERAGLVPVITHMKVQGADQGRADEALAMMRAATARGVYTAADVYPYLAGHGMIAQLLMPGWALDGGRSALGQRLRDPALRDRIVSETDALVAARLRTAANVRVVGSDRSIPELMPALGARSAGEAIARVVEHDPSAAMIATFGAEPDLVRIMQYPDAAIACDCGAALRAAHPRTFGTFPRVLGRYVREMGALPLPEAVRKMTGLPATIVGMVDRGFIAPGMAADLTVFDPATVIDRATYEKPTEWPEGIRHVIVNGRMALRDGEPTGVHAGRSLRRLRAMPSRPMRVSSARDVRLEADEAGRRLSVDLGGEVLRVTGAGAALEATAFGLLQTALRWSSVTGLAREAGSGATLGFALIVDEAEGAVVLLADGRPAQTWTFKP